MMAPNQTAQDAAVAASAARVLEESAQFLTALRAIQIDDLHAGTISSLCADERHFCRCLASALAKGIDPAEYIEALRALGAGDS